MIAALLVAVLLLSPSPLRGEGGGEGIDAILLDAQRICADPDLTRIGIRTQGHAAQIMRMGADAAPRLVRDLRNPRLNWRYRFWLVDLSGYLREPRLAGPLLSIVEDSRDQPAVRRRAVTALVALGAKEMLPELTRAYRRERDPFVRERIGEGIRKLRLARRAGP